MIYNIYEISTVVIECLLVQVLFNAWFGIRALSRLKKTVYMLLYFTCQSVITLLPIFPTLRVIISLFLVIGIAGVMYKTVLSSALYSGILFIALAVLSELAAFVFLNTLGFKTEMQMYGGNARAINIALAKSVHFAVVLLTASVLRKNRTALTLKQVAPLIPCLVMSVYICIVFYNVYPAHGEDSSTMLLAALVGLLYMNGIIVMNTQSIKTTELENEEQRLASRHYEMQVQYYQSVYKDREETRALWHDLKKHVIAIEALIQDSGNLSAENEYTEIRQAFDKLGSVVDIDNTTLNAILHHNIDRAIANNIPVNLNVKVPAELGISAVDLSVIIGNTFDNAVEECLDLSHMDPKIDVTMKLKNRILFYEITNPCKEKPNKKDGKFRGYGLNNVKHCVAKYNGTIEHGIANGQYRVSISLNC